MTGHGEQPLYRCPKGGFHKFRRSWVTIILGAFGPRPSSAKMRVRKCTKCGTVWGSGKRLK